MNEPVTLGIHPMYPDVQIPKFETEYAACMDVRAYFGVNERFFTVYNNKNSHVKYFAISLHEGDPHHAVLLPGDRALIPTGLILNIPEDHHVLVYPRSGTTLKSGLMLTNSVGVIDSDYINQLYISVINNSEEKVIINHGDRIAQIILRENLRYFAIQSNKPERKSSRAGGFGSTGIQ